MKPPLSPDSLAGAILDDSPVDWEHLAAEPGAIDARLIESLKTLATVRQAARRVGAPDDISGTEWGPLKVIERIARGTFGDVYRAWDTRLDREVALKLLPAGSAGSETESAVINEGRMLARLRHPNVVTIYGAERIAGRVGLWMELVKGVTLEQAFHDTSRLPAREVVRIGVELCGAVAAVHAAGLLHRDIKAQNVMVADDGRLVLMDFGTGLDLEGPTDPHITGTPLYLAPEVLAGGSASVRSDVYAIGVLLHRLATGRFPVEGRDLSGLREAHASRVRGETTPADGGIPRGLRRVIARALDPNPGARFADADACGAALSRLARARATRARGIMLAAGVIAVASAVVSWRSIGSWMGRMPTSGTVSAASTTPAIVVMPFRNLSSEPDSGFFVDGLTMEVIRNLGLIDGLEVRSQTSSLLLKDRPRNLRQIGEDLHVNLALEADVFRLGNRLRISVQLVNIGNDQAPWSQVFDRTVDDVFEIQQEISRAIVNELRLTLGGGQRRYQTSIPLYETYLRGLVIAGHRGTESGRQAAQLFEQVIAADPEFALAYAGLAAAYAQMSSQISGLTNEEGLKGMRPAAMKALEIDPFLAEAHMAMGLTYARERQWAEARASFDRAVELDVNLPDTYIQYAYSTLLPQGDLQRAEQMLRTAITLDPLAPAVRRDLGLILFCQGRYDEAIDSLQMALSNDPGFPFTNQLIARALTFAGEPAKAIDVWEHRPSSDGPWERWIATAYVRAGRQADVDRLIEAHLTEHPYRQALIYAALGDKDRTFEALNRAVDLAPHRTAQTLVYPEMALLRGDPRLDALRRRLNLQ